MPPRLLLIFLTLFVTSRKHPMGAGPRRAFYFLVSAVCCFVFGGSVCGSQAARADSFDQDRRYGYISSADEEKNLSEDVPISMPELPTSDGPVLRDRIFNAQLSKEFRQRYEEQFGRTAAEQSVNIYNNPYTTYRNDQGAEVSAFDQNAAQQSYGNYMVAKMAEYHVENWAKKDESTRGIYNLKEKLSKFNAEIAPGVSFTTNYSISENSFDTELKNPYVHTRWRYLLSLNEMYFQFDRQLFSTYSLANFVAVRDSTVKLVGTKGLTKTIGFTQTIGTFFGTGYSTRETIGLIGFDFHI